MEEAMDWFLRLKEPSRSRDDERDFAFWIGKSPLHREAWAKACRTWEVMGATSPVNEDFWKSGNGTQVARRHIPGWRLKVGAGIALAACLVGLVVSPSLITRYQADYTTATAEIRRITLEDGSIVDMGAASAIAVDFTAGSRRVELLSGEAFFDVRHDGQRPFLVDTGEIEVRVMGTAFDVNIAPETTTVQLARGIVGVSTAHRGETMELSPGEVATFDRETGRLSQETIAIETIASWRERRLFVQDVPISTVVEELQRYHPSWIRIASNDLANRRITGLYDLSDPDRALEALVSPYGGKVHHLSRYLRVLALF